MKGKVSAKKVVQKKGKAMAFGQWFIYIAT